MKETVELKTVFGDEVCDWGKPHYQGVTYKLTLGDHHLTACTIHLVQIRKMINAAIPPVVE